MTCLFSTVSPDLVIHRGRAEVDHAAPDDGIGPRRRRKESQGRRYSRRHQVRSPPAPKHLMAAAVAASLALLAPAARADPVVGGGVVDFRPPSIDYEIRRDMENGRVEVLPVAYFIELLLGDRVVVRPGGAWIDVDLGGKTVRVSPENSPFRVPVAMGAPPSVWRNASGSIVKTVGEWLTMRRNWEVEGSTVGVTSRGGEQLALPLLSETRSGLLPGTARCALRGVVARRHATVGDGLGWHPPAVAPDLGKPQTGPVEVDLLPGDFAVDLGDDSGSVKGAFTAVPGREMPEPPPADGAAIIDSRARVTLNSAWLARQDGGAWRYEAFLRLRESDDGGDPARLLAEILATGHVP